MAKVKIIPETTTQARRDAQAGRDIANLVALEAALAKFGDGQPYSRSRIEGEARIHIAHSAVSMLEAGKRLALLRAKEEHGEFLTCLERIGVKRRIAYMMMNAADKFLDDHGRSKFQTSGSLQTFANLGVSKIYELATLDVEEIDQLAKEGEATGITLEEAAQLSVRELKRKLKERDAEIKQMREQAVSDAEVQRQILAEKNQKIDALDARLRSATDPARWQERAEQALLRLHALGPQYSRMVGEFAELLEEINAMQVGEWEHSQMLLLEHARHTFDEFSGALDALGRRLDFMAPAGNAVFHALTSLRRVHESPLTCEVDGV